MENLKNKVAVVTGGNSGIGYAGAKELKQSGARVFITGRREEALKTAASELDVEYIVADQSKVSDIENLVDKVSETAGKVDILFINAGVLATGSIAETTEETFDRVMDINLKGAYFTLSRFIPILNDAASVVFLSSNTASMYNPNSSVYSSGKAALNSIMKIAALELSGRGIRVNAISPGPTETEILKKQGHNEQELKGINDWILERIPLGYMGEAVNVGKMLAYLSGQQSKFITGAEFIMDGGMHL